MNNCQIQIVENLVLKASEILNVPASEIKGRNQKEEYCIARALVWAACKKSIKKMTLRELGSYFSRDHKTVYYGIKNICDDIEVNNERRVMYKELVNG